MATEMEKDPVTGTETTGHEWDGIKELNTPLPRWWIITLWVCVAWAGLYIIVYPAFPGWEGLWKYTARKDVAVQMEAVQAGRSEWLDKLAAASMEDIGKDGDLLAFAMAGGRAAFADNCAPCHGSGGAGGPGYPNLLDDDWIWGGTLDDIQTTITHGIRWAQDDDTRISEMPRFGVDEFLDKPQINAVADYVLSLSGGGAAAGDGAEIFAENCAACHGESGGGSAEFGAPRLSDAIWLYGGDKAIVVETITNARSGVMPAWGGRLDEVTVKQLAVYVHSLGGGQ
jgi:cytochrome c oxidase cbb3-type subunit 3